jgi:hypothetical protein
MMRLCTHNNRPCDCGDVEAQPCIGGIVEKYLNALRMYVQSGGLDGAAELALGRRGLAIITTTFATKEEFENWRRTRPTFWRHQ